MNVTVTDFTGEKAFVAVLKLHVYATIHDSYIKAVGGDTALPPGARIEFGRFTARKTNYLFVPENGNRPRCSAEFYGFTSHKVREKLTAIADKGVVELVGRGLRDAQTYRWTSAITLPELASFMVFRRVTQDDLSMNLEVKRIASRAGVDTFSLRDFVETYLDAHAEEYGASRWGKRKFEKLRNSYDYDNFLKLRLEKLARNRLVMTNGKGEFKLNPDLRDELHHFDLFVDSVQYEPSRELVQRIGLDRALHSQALMELLKRSGNGHYEEAIQGLRERGAL